MTDIFKNAIKHPVATCTVIGAITGGIVKIIKAAKKSK